MSVSTHTAPDKEAIDLEAQTTTNITNGNSTPNSDLVQAKVETHAENPDLIKIGDAWVSRRELLAAFGGTLNPGYALPPSRKFANPAPLGLCAFALTTFVLCLTNVQARGVSESSVVIGLAYFYGGIVQALAGMWEMAVENTFGATALTSFGGFWLAFAALETNAFGIASGYSSPVHLSYAIGFFLLGWFIFTFVLVLCTLRSTVAFFLLFFFLDLAFLFLGVAHLYPSDEGVPHIAVNKAGGYFGLFAAFAAWYNAFAGLATHENSLIIIKPLPMPWNLAYKALKKSKST
ncbi:putative ammonium permease [Lipomyces japonicus]|uniref:putative ammonium permease n=1 Tax=Lipomyces japonicus TaxID=56871 RepID=UPI0034D00B82